MLGGGFKARPLPCWGERGGAGEREHVEETHILLSATLKTLYILWMKLLSIWCKVVRVLPLLPSGKDHLVGGSGPWASCPRQCLSLLAQGWGWASKLAHSLVPSLPTPGGVRLGVGPTARAPRARACGVRSGPLEAARLLAEGSYLVSQQ